MPEAKRSAKEVAESRGAMLDRLKAEQARGWPRSSAGVWLDDTRGYAPLDSIPVRDEVEFGYEGLEPIPPHQQLLEELRGTPTLFDEFGGDNDKATRRAERRTNFMRTGALDG